MTSDCSVPDVDNPIDEGPIDDSVQMYPEPSVLPPGQQRELYIISSGESQEPELQMREQVHATVQALASMELDPTVIRIARNISALNIGTSIVSIYPSSIVEEAPLLRDIVYDERGHFTVS